MSEKPEPPKETARLAGILMQAGQGDIPPAAALLAASAAVIEAIKHRRMQGGDSK